jgi:hypothetical protein
LRHTENESGDRAAKAFGRSIRLKATAFPLRPSHRGREPPAGLPGLFSVPQALGFLHGAFLGPIPSAFALLKGKWMSLSLNPDYLKRYQDLARLFLKYGRFDIISGADGAQTK